MHIEQVAIVESPGLTDQDLAEIRRLCDDAWGGEFTDDDWDHTLGGQHAIVRSNGRIVAHAAMVPRTVRFGEQAIDVGYVEGVVTTPALQGRGLGRRAMTELTARLVDRHDVGLLATRVHDFYEAMGWERWRGPTFVRTAAGLVRTADEDDGIMVYRFGPSVDLDLTDAITCDERVGDDW